MQKKERSLLIIFFMMKNSSVLILSTIFTYYVYCNLCICLLSQTEQETKKMNVFFFYKRISNGIKYFVFTLGDTVHYGIKYF